jgi:hypothetical protein
MQRGRRRASGVWTAVGLVALLGVLTACVPPPPDVLPTTTTTTTAPTTAPSTARTLVLYGDSLALQSRGEIRRRLGALLPGWNVILQVYGGTAQCDWHDDMAVDAAAHDVDVVVIAFSGNYMTNCITGVPPGSRNRVAGYEADANWAVDFWRPKGASLLFVAGPTSVGVHVDPFPTNAPDPERWDAIRDVYARVGTQRGVNVADEAPLFADPASQVYKTWMPCLVGECVPSVEWKPVRNADHVHFCVDALVGPDGCVNYSSGVVRYADPIVRGVAGLLGLPMPARTLAPVTTPSPSP